MLGLLALNLFAQSASASVDPERVVVPPLSIFSRHNQQLEDDEVLVKVTAWDERSGEFKNKSSNLTISAADYEQYQNLSSAVFEKLARNTSVIKEDNNKEGTAFHIGENLVLTNAHVLSSTRRNLTRCSGFELRDSISAKTYQCHKVHFCSSENDVCLLEMKEDRKRPLSDGPALKLLNNFFPRPGLWDNTTLTSIGNSGGFGIHLAKGRGMTIAMNFVTFQAPITSGNSGGPLLTEEGLVVGVVREQSLQKIKLHRDDQVYNTATRIDLTIKLIRQALAQDPVTLEKFNRSVVE
ncbi:MAG TPA: serine protease [Bacteriovoracaceae bacterium]|nr:serine protease [Bacteriovoracaceae bacterium]